MPRIASGFASEGRRLRSILAAPLLLAFALFAPTDRATAQTIAFPSTDNDQLALAGNPVPNPLRASNDNEVPDILLWTIVSDGTKIPYRIKIRTGSFTALSIFEKIVPGLMIADLVAVIGSFDIVLPEVDR